MFISRNVPHFPFSKELNMTATKILILRLAAFSESPLRQTLPPDVSQPACDMQHSDPDASQRIDRSCPTKILVVFIVVGSKFILLKVSLKWLGAHGYRSMPFTLRHGPKN